MRYDQKKIEAVLDAVLTKIGPDRFSVIAYEANDTMVANAPVSHVVAR
ncbi:MAG: hypothetical protein WB689_22355 [Xanthobacteraceae bacterium]